MYQYVLIQPKRTYIRVAVLFSPSRQAELQALHLSKQLLHEVAALRTGTGAQAAAVADEIGARQLREQAPESTDNCQRLNMLDL